MIKNGYTINFPVKYSEMDCGLALKPSVLLNFLQDTANENAEKLGFGYSNIKEKNLMWYLLKYRMEFSAYPVEADMLTIKTEPRGYAKLFTYRDFELYRDADCIGRISSLWALADIDTKALVSAGSVLSNPNLPPHEKREDDLNFAKIPILKKVDAEKIFEIRYEDIDANIHVNNGNYIVWALEPLDFDFRRGHKIKTLDIVFKKEIRYGHQILAQAEFDGKERTIHTLKNFETGEDLCHVMIDWTES